MTTHAAPQAPVNARTVLLPYLLGVIAAMLLIQAAIALTGGEVTVLAGALTALVAAGISTWMWLKCRTLTKIRFGFAMGHAIAFVVVTTSFNAHAVVRTIALGAAGSEGAAAHGLLATPWFGATLVMSAAWGIGLLIHLTGVVLGRGWED